MPTERRFADWLSQALGRSQLSPRQAAELIGVREATIRRWLAGRGRPAPSNCQAIADAFGAPVNLVLELAGHDRYF